MRFQALASDYDGTIADDGEVSDEVWDAIKKLRESGRKPILVTGRQLEDLRSVCPRLDRFDSIVAENGGVLYSPATGEQRLLAPAPPPELIQSLRKRGVRHLEIGQTLLGTVRPHETEAMEAIRDLGIEWKIVFNKEAVMIVSPGVSKASGLKAALDELSLSQHNVVGVGDAENDHAFLTFCECSVAVANALPMLKKSADIITRGQSSRGVMELIDELLADDLRSREHELKRHQMVLGKRLGVEDAVEKFSPYGTVALLAGSSGGGKTSATLRLLEQLVEGQYQFCVFDPEGDYDTFGEAVIMGGPHHPPAVEEVLQLLRKPRQNVVVNMLRVPFHERPQFCASLLTRFQEVRVRTGRPHWLIFDEAHHLFPANWDAAQSVVPVQLETALLVTVHPNELSPIILKQVNLGLAVGAEPAETLRELAEGIGQAPPRGAGVKLERHQALVWRLGDQERSSVLVKMDEAKTEHRRHIRKYAEGLLIPERSFYFRGPENKLNLRAHNLLLFLELADGVDDDTWLFHLHQGDYSRWFEEIIGDRELTQETEAVERDENLSAAESRDRIRAAVQRRYTLPENPSLPKLDKTS